MKRAKSGGTSKRRTPPRDIDEYLAAVPADARAALERLRKLIQAAAPGASEAIGYQMPAFRYRGKLLVCFAAFKAHCSLFPMSSAVIRLHAADVKGFETDKGTIRFAADKPLPVAIVRKIIKARIAESEKRK